jgi:hypothetical protein
MVRKLGEFSNFVVFNSQTESSENSSIFAFSLPLFALYRFLYLPNVINLGLVLFSWLCSMGHHLPGFPRVLYDTLLHLRYNGNVSVYHARMSMAHSMEQCEVSITMPLNPMESWMAAVIGVELDDPVEQTTQVALTSLCGSRLADTAAMPITLFSVRYWGDPVW